jgi:hypothetical protein
MSFQSQTATTFVKLNLTDLGRQKMALGRFSIDQVVFSDREVRYAFNRRYPVGDPKFANMNPTSDKLYGVENNKVLSPAFAAPGLPSRNFDGSNPYQIGNRVIASTQLLTARTESRGLWSAVTEGSNQEIGDYILDSNKYQTSGSTSGNQFLGSPNFQSFFGTLVSKSFLYFKHRPPTSAQPALDTQKPIHSLWYRIRAAGDLAFCDRDLPLFNGGSHPYQYYCYPALSTTEYWNSGTTSPGEVWSLNIVRTSNVLGTNALGSTGYTAYGSKEFAGTRRYFGFNKEHRAVGFVWHQDKFTGNTYGDLFIPRTTQLDLPDLMWHRKRGILPGTAIKAGHRFVDAGSGIFFDDVAKSNYTELKDGTEPNAEVVGRVYYNLKVIVITDQELLTSMTYKSNRNYTLPKLNVELTDAHPDSTLSVSPWIQDGYTYYFTYYMRNNSPYSSEVSYGFKPASPCEYWTEVVGQNKPDGTGYYASVSFEPSGFPYMRDQTNMESLSGTGWMANQVQLLVNALPTAEAGASGVDRVRPDTWTAITDGSTAANTDGVYIGEAGHDNIRPQYLGTRMFNLHNGDITSGTIDYNGNTPAYVMPPAQTTSWSFTGATGVTFGDELFLNGNVKTTFGLRTEKLVATVSINKDELNSSKNGGYDGRIDESTFITEIALLNNRGELMAVGKPTYPIRKNDARHLLFQLEIDI